MAAAVTTYSFSLHDTALSAALWCVWILVLADGAPYRRYEVICSCLAISYEACARLAYSYAWAAEILAQPLVVFEKTAELELRHGLFWA